MERLRIGALQYYIRPIQRFDQFQDQITALVETAVDYRCRLVVFPEYCTTQLLTLGDVKRPISMQVRNLSEKVDQFVDMMSALARKHGRYIAAGSIPAVDDGGERVFSRVFSSAVPVNSVRWISST